MGKKNRGETEKTHRGTQRGNIPLTPQHTFLKRPSKALRKRGP